MAKYMQDNWQWFPFKPMLFSKSIVDSKGSPQMLWYSAGYP